MIPLSSPNLSGNEWQYLKDCLDTGWVSSAGSYVGRFEKSVASFCGAAHAVATSSGTTALHISLLLGGVSPGDLVIVPDLTFVAPVNAVRYVQAAPLLMDIDPHTWQMDLGLLEDFLQNQTSVRDNHCFHRATQTRIAAILPVHILGNCGDMDRLMRIAAAHSLVVIEDASEALGSQFAGKQAGNFGLLGCLSFNGNKIITTGGGGMIITANESLANRARHLTTQAKASPDEYYHDEVGYNYRMVNLLAALGMAQMEQLPAFLDHKKKITVIYDEALGSLPGFRRQQIPDKGSPNHWLYTLYVPRLQELRQFLKLQEIECRPLWVPMHRLPPFRQSLFITREHQSDDLYAHAISIPCSTHLTEGQQQEVIRAVNQFYHG
ncbi:MAG TPA: LegC family aminotransferase [Chitinophagaceae bacterium]|nr:LegC family aminotransferase [Chitinophagaceae bacterium]